MKKVLKIFGIIIGSVLAVIILVLAFFQLKPLPTYEVVDSGLSVEVTPERVQQGALISNNLCSICHVSEGGKLEGAFMGDGGPIGKIYSANITQDENFGIGTYTDGELYYLLRTGIAKDGRLTLPMMQRFVKMSDEDIYSIIAFLRSDDPVIQPSENVIPAYKPTFLTKILFNVAWKPFPFDGNPVVAPDKSNTIEYGKYLVQGRYICYECHSKGHETNDHFNPEMSEGYMAGGTMFLDHLNPDTLYAANITPHAEDGIGNYSLEEFIAAVKYGEKKEGGMVGRPMVPYVGADTADVTAIYEYLKTVPALPGN